MIAYLERMEITPKVNDQKYKIKYTIPTAEELVPDIDVCVRILQVEDDKVCVEFTNTNENNNKFLEHYNDMVYNVLDFSNNAWH